MDSNIKNLVRPLYSELQGLLKEAPSVGENGNTTSYDSAMWSHYNSTVDELNRISGLDFNKFKISGIRRNTHLGDFINISEYRTKLGGLIARLHGTYFEDQTAPFAGMPNTIITQNQSQSIDVQILLDLQSKIVEELPKHSEGTKERSFLQKLKDSLPSLKNGTDILSSALRIGADLGLTPSTIHKLLGL